MATKPVDDTKLALTQSANPGPKPRRGKKTADTSKCFLVQLANAGLAKNTSAHDALAQAGLIQPLFNIQNLPA
jgi:hypothetical protein